MENLEENLKTQENQIENSDDDQLISEVYLDSTDESDGDESESYHHNSEPTTNIENVKLEQRSTKDYCKSNGVSSNQSNGKFESGVQIMAPNRSSYEQIFTFRFNENNTSEKTSDVNTVDKIAQSLQSKQLSSPNNKNYSAAIKRKEKTFECPTCKKKFGSKSSLYNHKKLHEKSNPNQCKICLKFFQSNYHLKRHSKTHFDKMPYACTICETKYNRLCRFSTKYQLQLHQTTHGGDGNFKCIPCNRSFKTKTNLNIHMLSHYEPKFSCDKCGMKFHTLSGLKQHDKKKHTD